VPFFSAVIAFFVQLDRTPSILIWKCLPVICLLFFVLLDGLGLKKRSVFRSRILVALIFCCIGDACLVWEESFIFGMGAFAIGHFFYISAFGFQPLNLPVGIILFATAGYVVNFWIDRLPSTDLVVGVPIYTAILTTMAWRAIARVRFSEVDWTWTHVCTALGAISFAISDGFIAFDMFYSKIPHAKVWIMTTYYAAQLGLALSVVDERKNLHRD